LCNPETMNFQKTVSELEQRAAALGQPMYLVCEQAGIAPSTYYRWKKSGDATFSSIEKIDRTLSRFERRRDKAASLKAVAG